MVVEIEFSDIGKLLDEIGWEDVKEHFSEEIEAECDDAYERGRDEAEAKVL